MVDNEIMINRLAKWLALAAVVCTLAAFLFLALYPCSVRSVSSRATSEGGREVQAPIVETTCSSLLGSQGLGILVLLGIPVALALIGVVGLRLRQPLVVWFAALTTMVFAVLTGFSVGLFFFPAGGLLIASAITQHAGGHESV